MFFEPKRDKYLRLLMYELYYITDVESFSFNPQKYPDSTDWKECIAALQWSMENTDYDYRKLLPNLRFSNAEIALFLSFLHEHISAEVIK